MLFLSCLQRPNESSMRRHVESRPIAMQTSIEVEPQVDPIYLQRNHMGVPGWLKIYMFKPGPPILLNVIWFLCFFWILWCSFLLSAYRNWNMYISKPTPRMQYAIVKANHSNIALFHPDITWFQPNWKRAKTCENKYVQWSSPRSGDNENRFGTATWIIWVFLLCYVRSLNCLFQAFFDDWCGLNLIYLTIHPALIM